MGWRWDRALHIQETVGTHERAEQPGTGLGREKKQNLVSPISITFTSGNMGTGVKPKSGLTSSENISKEGEKIVKTKRSRREVWRGEFSVDSSSICLPSRSRGGK